MGVGQIIIFFGNFLSKKIVSCYIRGKLSEMKPIRKRLKLGERDYYRMHLSIITSMLPVTLTERELDVLAEFMVFKDVFAEDRFGTTQRKIVRKNLGLKAPNLSNLLKGLTLKGVIRDGNILPVFLPNDDVQKYEFLLENGG